ncbi:MAG: hypothetical protein Q9186_003395 [Xanthomendoza sp. 1 TL-2023]
MVDMFSALHGYSHENPTRMNLEQQHAILDKTYKQLTDFCGKPPRGVVAPWWESSKEGAELMMRYGVEYDHSFSHHDCLPYYLRIGDSWTPIDYDKHPSHWMKPLEPGRPTGFVEIPSNWYLDDLPPMMFIKKAPNSHGWVNPRDVEDLWRDHFDYFNREYDDFCFTVTLHPDVSGHPHVIFMLERLIEYIGGKEGVEWVKMEDICDDFKKKNQPAKGALLPAEHGAIAKDPTTAASAANVYHLLSTFEPCRRPADPQMDDAFRNWPAQSLAPLPAAQDMQTAGDGHYAEHLGNGKSAAARGQVHPKNSLIGTDDDLDVIRIVHVLARANQDILLDASLSLVRKFYQLHRDQHEGTYAGDSIELHVKYPCGFPGCERGGDNGFPRKDKLKSHFENVHRGRGIPPKQPRALAPLK